MDTEHKHPIRPPWRLSALRIRRRQRRTGNEYVRWARRVAIGGMGTTVLVLGVVMLVLPGPAILVIPLGLAILATEFVWARRWLKRARGMMTNMGMGSKRPPA